MVCIILGLLFLLLISVLIVLEIDDILCGIGYIVVFIMSFLLIEAGIMKGYENNAMKEHNINPDIIEYIVNIRDQKNATSITTNDAITIYIECKRNGLSEEETILFLLSDITIEEAKSIVKTYNLLEKEN